MNPGLDVLTPGMRKDGFQCSQKPPTIPKVTKAGICPRLPLLPGLRLLQRPAGGWGQRFRGCLGVSCPFHLGESHRDRPIQLLPMLGSPKTPHPRLVLPVVGPFPWPRSPQGCSWCWLHPVLLRGTKLTLSRFPSLSRWEAAGYSRAQRRKGKPSPSLGCSGGRNPIPELGRSLSFPEASAPPSPLLQHPLDQRFSGWMG